MHNMLNLEADGLQQQKTTLGSTSVSQEQKTEAVVGLAFVYLSRNPDLSDQVMFFQLSTVQFW